MGNETVRIWACAVVLMAGRLDAQRVAVAKPATAPSGVLVTVDVDTMPLKHVLKLIAQQAGLTPYYGASVAKSPITVTVHLQRVPVSEAFDMALNGTNLRATIVGATVLFESGDNVAVVSGGITGRVLDGRTKQPVRGATVSLDAMKKGVTTGDDGAFRLTNVASGEHVLRVKMLGYGKVSKTVAVVDDQVVAVDIALESSVNTLDQVVVTGTVVATELKAVPNAITVITGQELEQRGITHIDQLFRGDVPGVWVKDQGSAASYPGQVQMASRGATTFDADRLTNSALGQTIKTYVDGIELSNPQFLGLLDPKSIERVEILTGPQASTIYGSSAINGVMQIFTKRGATSKPQLTVHLGAGWTQNKLNAALAGTNQGDARVSGVDGTTSYNAGGGVVYSGNWASSTRITTYSGDGGAHLQHGPVSVDGSYRISQGTNVVRSWPNVGDLAGEEDGMFAWVPYHFMLTRNRYTQLGQTEGVTVAYAPLTWWSHALTVGLDREESASETPPTFFSTNNSNDTLLIYFRDVTGATTVSYNTTLRATLLPQAVLTITGGGDATKSALLHLGFAGRRWESTGFNDAPPQAQDWQTFPTHRRGLFTQNQLALWDALFFTYGVRWEYNPAFGDEANPNMQPRYGVAMTREMGPVTVKFRASYGHSTQPPPLGQKLGIHITDPSQIAAFGGDAYAIAPNPELVPSEQRGGEGGIELYWGARNSLQITRYNQTVTHVIQSIARIDSIPRLDGNPDPHGWCRYSPSYCVPSLMNDAYMTPTHFLNMGDLRNQGWEAIATAATGPLTYRLTYSLTKSRLIGITPRYRKFFPYLVPGQSFVDVPEHTYAMAVTYSSSATSLSVNLQGQGVVWRPGFNQSTFGSDNCPAICRGYQTRLTANYAPRVTDLFYRHDIFYSAFPGYARADVNLNQRVTSWLEGTLQLNNVTNTYASDLSQGYAVPGRQETLGLRLRF